MIKHESEIYQRLGLPHIPAEMREDEGEIELALAGKLSQDLITLADIRGMTHCHTTSSSPVSRTRHASSMVCRVSR